MQIALFVGTTSTEVGKDGPTKFYGGEIADIVDKEAESLLAQGFAAMADSKEAKEFLAKLPRANPKTRRMRLDAETPGLAERVKVKNAMKEAAERVRAEAKAEAEKKTTTTRRRRPLEDLGAGLNGAAKKVD